MRNHTPRSDRTLAGLVAVRQLVVYVVSVECSPTVAAASLKKDQVPKVNDLSSMWSWLSKSKMGSRQKPQSSYVWRTSV